MPETLMKRIKMNEREFVNKEKILRLPMLEDLDKKFEMKSTHITKMTRMKDSFIA